MVTPLSRSKHAQRNHKAGVWEMGKYKAVVTPGTGVWLVCGGYDAGSVVQWPWGQDSACRCMWSGRRPGVWSASICRVAMMLVIHDVGSCRITTAPGSGVHSCMKQWYHLGPGQEHTRRITDLAFWHVHSGIRMGSGAQSSRSFLWVHTGRTLSSPVNCYPHW